MGTEGIPEVIGMELERNLNLNEGGNIVQINAMGGFYFCKEEKERIGYDQLGGSVRAMGEKKAVESRWKPTESASGAKEKKANNNESHPNMLPPGKLSSPAAQIKSHTHTHTHTHG